MPPPPRWTAISVLAALPLILKLPEEHSKYFAFNDFREVPQAQFFPGQTLASPLLRAPSRREFLKNLPASLEGCNPYSY